MALKNPFQDHFQRIVRFLVVGLGKLARDSPLLDGKHLVFDKAENAATVKCWSSPIRAPQMCIRDRTDRELARDGFELPVRQTIDSVNDTKLCLLYTSRPTAPACAACSPRNIRGRVPATSSPT